MKVEFIGHACVYLEENGDKLIFDPFIDNNPQAQVKSSDISANYILLSHYHDDHKGETEEIAKANDSQIISTAEIAGDLSNKGLNAHPMHLGGVTSFDFGYVRVTPAFHGSGIAGGHACGFVINFHGKTIYYAGDTALFSDMKLISDLEDIDLAFLPIGDNFTMGVKDAVMAVKYVQPKAVVPMHYNTWPLIPADGENFKELVDNETESECLVLEPGESMEFK